MADSRQAPTHLSRDPARRFHAGFEPVGPGTLAGRYLRSFWQPVLRAADLAAGKARPLTVMGEEFTIFRGASGAPHLLAARCPHRGTRLSAGMVEGDCLRCFYHGWKFDAHGTCVEQPGGDATLMGEARVPAYPAREYLGLIFAYLGPGTAPAFPRLTHYEDNGYLDVGVTLRGCSYFKQLENSVDEAHINFVHRVSTFADAGYTAVTPVIQARETEYGIERASRRGNETRIGHLIMPNLLNTTIFDNAAGWIQHLSWRTPVDDGAHLSFMVDLVQLEGEALQRYRERRAEEDRIVAALPPAEEIGKAILRGECSLAEFEARPDLLTIQDTVALLGQEGAERERDLLSPTDGSVVLLRRIWGRELMALAEGKALKNWIIPPGLHVTFAHVAG